MAENIGAASAQPEPDYDPGIPHGQSEASLRTLIARMEQEMAELQFERFAAADALALGLLLVELGTERSLPIAIDISRDEHVLFHVSLAGATADNGIWARAKSRTAARYAEPSLLVGLRARLQGQRMEDNPLFDSTRYAAHGGSFPVFVRGVGPVAAVTVSGLPQKEDHDLVVEALRIFSRDSGG